MAKTTRTSRSRASAAPAAVAQAEVVEEKKEGGFETGVAILTAIMLIAACLLIDKELGAMGTGMFFGK